MNVYIARLRRFWYLLVRGMRQGEVACDLHDNRGLYELSSGRSDGTNRRIWWSR